MMDEITANVTLYIENLLSQYVVRATECINYTQLVSWRHSRYHKAVSYPHIVSGTVVFVPLPYA